MSKSHADWEQVPLCRRRTSDIDVEVGARTRARREQLGLSRDDLARAAGISLRALRSYEAGTVRPTPAELCAIAVSLAVSIAYFFAPIGQFREQTTNFSADGS